MFLIKLGKIEDTNTVTLPRAVVEALDLHENENMIVEIIGDKVVLMRATDDIRDAWEAYQSIESHYQNANRELKE